MGGHERGDTQHFQARDADWPPVGAFRITQLGPGEHLLEVHAAAYYTAQERHDVGRYAPEVVVRLDPHAP